ncbi:MAG: THUMP domain-containing protein [archaeon]|nr:THUMP domain-containing protein [archaeon]
MENNCVLVKLSPEISLKTNYVRGYFLTKLISNIKQVVRAKKLSGNRIVRGGGRLYIFPKDKQKVMGLCLALKGVFGVSFVAPCKLVLSKSRSEIMDAALSVALDFIKPGDTFAVRLKNTLEKSFSSREFEATLGSKIISKIKNLKVNLDNPGKKLSIEVGPKGCFLYVEEIQGLAGLPLGCEGNVAVFFEGKKEELAAAFLMMKRGCNIFPVSTNFSTELKVHVNKLVKFNSFRSFKFSTLDELDELVSKKDISVKAIVFSNDSYSKQLSEQKQNFSLAVYWPLLFAPKGMLKETLVMIDGD